ncbi:hypothetical protein DFH08DRAFT_798347 [Mycena albidolilacea]|uniref:Uncharacterized protein n=1 Tax=Mycena albidolilacea TaxID=1033008 RepID=A0AAD7AP96_9AGAR|nr:hypothetical protein DFH08DRAFT_798347 [Mycena albidolilacea]
MRERSERSSAQLEGSEEGEVGPITWGCRSVGVYGKKAGRHADGCRRAPGLEWIQGEGTTGCLGLSLLSDLASARGFSQDMKGIQVLGYRASAGGRIRANGNTCNPSVRDHVVLDGIKQLHGCSAGEGGFLVWVWVWREEQDAIAGDAWKQKAASRFNKNGSRLAYLLEGTPQHGVVDAFRFCWFSEIGSDASMEGCAWYGQFTKKHPQGDESSAVFRADRASCLWAVAAIRKRIQDAAFYAARADIDAALELMRDDFVQSWGPKFSARRRAKRARRLARRAQEQLAANLQAHPAPDLWAPTPINDPNSNVWGTGDWGSGDGEGGWPWAQDVWGTANTGTSSLWAASIGTTWGWTTTSNSIVVSTGVDNPPAPSPRGRRKPMPDSQDRHMGSSFRKPRMEPRSCTEMPAGTANTAAAASAASTTSLPAKYSFVCTFFNQLLWAVRKWI